MLPIPKHLKDLLSPIGKENDEFQVKGIVRCTCGNENFIVKLFADLEEGYPRVREYENQYAFAVYVTCDDCQKEHILFDMSNHGWNGFVCNDGVTVPKNILEQYNCNNCGGGTHTIEVTISSQGKDDFIEETNNEFDENDWVEAFEFISINLKCSSCDCLNADWVSYETM